MKIVYSVVNHLYSGQVEIAYTSEERAYRELKKLVKDYIENEYDYYSKCDGIVEDEKAMRKLLNKKFNMDVFYEIDALMSRQDYDTIMEDFYILPIVLNP